MYEFRLPDDFLIGTANSAFQSEGAMDRDGKSENVMEHYAKAFAGKPQPNKYPGKHKQANRGEYIITEDLPEPGCFFYDNYEKYIEDMQKTGQNTYRMSLSWCRIIPDGVGEVNQSGIDFYNKVIDKLISCNITPLVDLVHWDIPQCLMDKGGYTSDEFPEWYEYYAKVCFEAFGDRVPLWSTFNESTVCISSAYTIGRFPPFHKDLSLAMRGNVNCVLAHFRAVRLYHSMHLNGKIGCVNAIVPYYPATTTEIDIKAADRRAKYQYDMWAGPMLEGTFPKEVVEECEAYKAVMPEGWQEKFDKYFEKMDFMGINYYFPDRIGYDPDEPLKSTFAENFYSTKDKLYAEYPAGLMDVVIQLTKRYGKDIPMYVTENGISLLNHHDKEQDCNDEERIAYIREHLRMCARLCDLGFNLKGYYYWNDADSYEELTGYEYRFGLTYVDHKTGETCWKKSRYYYQKVCQSRMVD